MPLPNTIEPCKVCGGTDLNLVDGFYYCVECGTQDQTARETVVERVELADGNFAVAKRRKLTKKKTKLQMSGEWYKWHAFNFILCGLTDELIALGAKPSLKSVVLWVWTRYIKKYHHRDEYLMNAPKKNQLINNNDDKGSKETESDQSDDETNPKTKDLNETLEASVKCTIKDIRTMTMTNIYGILYVALNLDKSEIQMSHLIRFIREGRLTFLNYTKFMPSEINVTKIPQWSNFVNSKTNPFSSCGLEKVSVALFKRLELGTPIIPDMKSMVNKYVKELCLPKDFLNLVLSLFELMPIEDAMWIHLKMTVKIFPGFESIAMSYVLMALKMCFGLDDDYEIKLSKVIDEINEEENHLKSYRLGISEPSERLFSFREWVTYLEFRKIILCQYYQPMASKHNFDDDNFIVSEVLKDGMTEDKIKRVNVELEQELLKKIPIVNSYDIMAKEEFPVSLTPLTTYTQFLITKIQDPEIKFRLSEDFSKYSLKYACVHMLLNDDDGKNVVKGVTEDKKTKGHKILGTMRFRKLKLENETVYIKDTDNKDWIKDFKGATVKTNSDKENLSGDESKEDVFSIDSKETKTEDAKEEPIKCETVEELDEEENIFNENFEDIEYSQQHNSSNDCLQEPEYVYEFNDEQFGSLHGHEANDSKPNVTARDFILGEYDPATFDRKEVIKRLILTACRKYKIPIPYHYREPKTVKRKTERPKPPNEVKRRRTVPGARTTEITNILTQYHTLLQQNKSGNVSQTQTDQVHPSQTDQIRNDTTQENETELNTTIENTDHLNNETETNVQNPTELNMSIENGITNDPINDIDDDNNNESDIDINDLLKEYDENIEDCLENDEVNAIIIKEITEFKKNREERLKLLKEELRKRKTELKQKAKKKSKKRLKSLDPLIPNPENVKNFKYYFRHYVLTLLLATPRQSCAFESELTANFPKSFKYILKLCASIIEVPTWTLYRVFQYLEIYMMEKV